MPLTPSTTDKFMKVGSPGSATTLSAPGYIAGGTSMTVGSTTNWATDTKLIFAVDRAQIVNGVEERIAGTYNEFEGIVTGSGAITSVVRRLGNAQNYPAGSLTRVYIPVSATRENDLIDGLAVSHTPDGKLKAAAVQEALNINSDGSTGWTPLANAPSVVATNGGRSFDIKFPNTNYTDRLSAGMRLRIPRSVAPPTQSADLNGTTATAINASPAGYNWTDSFSIEGNIWVDPAATGLNTILSRFNVSGFVFGLDINNSLRFYAKNSALTNRIYTSDAAMPTGRWVHVAVTVNLSAGTVKYYLDGLPISSQLTTAGTSTSITQAGTLALGSEGGTQNFFKGKMSDIRVWSAILTDQQVKDRANQLLIGNETSLVSAWSLNNTWNDSATNTPNNLTAQGSAVFAAVSPFNANAFAVIMTAPVFDGIDTKMTVQCPEGYLIPNQTLNAASYSSQKAPYGLPAALQGRLKLVEIEIRTGQVFSSTEADIAGMAATINVPAGVPLIATIDVTASNSTAATGYEIYLFADSAKIATRGAQTSTANVLASCTLQMPLPPTSGQHTYKARIARTGGAVNLLAANGSLGYFRIEALV